MQQIIPATTLVIAIIALSGCVTTKQTPRTDTVTMLATPTRASKAEVIATAKGFMREYFGKDAEEYFATPNPNDLELAFTDAEFSSKKGHWIVSFGNGHTCNVLVVEMDAAATRAVMSHIQGGLILQEGNRYDYDAPLTYRTLSEFRTAHAAERANVRKATAAAKK